MPETVSPATTLMVAFILALLGGSVLKFWLATRQVRHVALHRTTVPVRFKAAVTLAAHQKAADYTIAKTRFGLLELALGAATLLGWTLLGGLDLLNQVLMEFVGPGMAQQIALLVAFALIGALIELPLACYSTFEIEEHFGFNKSSLRLWVADLLKSSVIGAAIGIPLVAMILWLMGAAGTQWWLWAWAVWMGFNLLLLMVYPTFIAPLFNQFKPLDDESLKNRVTSLMQRCGFAAKGLFVMDGSRRSAHANAYFTGFGAAKRVVFYDTLLAKLSPAEVDAVLAHELGHFKHRHILKRLGTLFVISLAGFALLGWLSSQSWFYAALGVQPNLSADAPNDALALLLFMLVLPVFTLFVAPIAASLSRNHEFEADTYAVQQTSAADLSSALLRLYEDNASTLTPDPIYVRFYYSHPPAGERLARMVRA
ncbi:MAG: M48 family metallopeptidase [Rhodoferax sp.]|nr:M48 family metallopeptidase [Rhodoferax sp.]